MIDKTKAMQETSDQRSIKEQAMKLMKCYLAASAAAALLMSGAMAQTSGYPDKPITFVVPFAAGSGTDPLARALVVAVPQESTPPVLVDNKPGAGGTIAATPSARANWSVPLPAANGT